jgi:hypothetical protein
MHTVPSSLSSPSSTRITIRRFGRVGALVLSSLLGLGVLLQVFLAGAGIFVSSSRWALHATPGMSLGLFPLAFLLLAWIGQPGRWSLWLGGKVSAVTERRPNADLRPAGCLSALASWAGPG